MSSSSKRGIGFDSEEQPTMPEPSQTMAAIQSDGGRPPSVRESGSITSPWPSLDEQPLPCPSCGKLPKLKERYWYTEPHGGLLLVTRWYECRKWFGLRLCRRGPDHTNEKDWADLAQRCAAQKWNAQL